jgi:hypothetical protein
MGSAEVKTARRRAELLWQQHTREVQTREAAAQAKWRAPQQANRQDEDAKTARLRALRLAKTAEQRTPKRLRSPAEGGRSSSGR